MTDKETGIGAKLRILSFTPEEKEIVNKAIETPDGARYRRPEFYKRAILKYCKDILDERERCNSEAD